MKSLVFLILAGYAVRCDDTSNNYYVIQMPIEDTKEMKKPFKAYWNVPTMQCKSKKIPFENLYEKYGIIQNDNDRFRGEKVTILYDPGLFPALFKNETTGQFRFRNGGVPQEGDLEKHLAAFRSELEKSMPDPDYSGVAIIDFESWRPIFRQNFGVLVPYKDVSYEIERKIHWWWPKGWIQDEARKRFEVSAQTFMQKTLGIAKQMRPRASWGYYGFPYCFNMAGNNMQENCAERVQTENDQSDWLWADSTALYPSVYSSRELTSSQLAMLIRGRVREAVRAARQRVPILPYFWFRYREGGYLTEVDLDYALRTLYQSKASGVVIWGSSNDVNTVDKCLKLHDYVETIFGPAIAKYTKYQNRLAEESELEYINSLNNMTLLDNDTTAVNPIKETDNGTDKNDNTNISLDPEFHWNPPENYTEDLIKYIEEEFSKKSKSNDSVKERTENTTVNNNVNYSFLIDLIRSSLYNKISENDSNVSETKVVEKINTEVTESTDELQSTLPYSTTEYDLETSTLSTNLSYTESLEEIEAISTGNEEVTFTTEIYESVTKANNNEENTTKNYELTTSNDEFSATSTDVTVTLENKTYDTFEDEISSTTEGISDEIEVSNTFGDLETTRSIDVSTESEFQLNRSGDRFNVNRSYQPILLMHTLLLFGNICVCILCNSN